jgi:hypothetical protein
MERLIADDCMKDLKDALDRFEANMIAAFRSYDQGPEPAPYVETDADRPLAEIALRIESLKTRR